MTNLAEKLKQLSISTCIGCETPITLIIGDTVINNLYVSSVKVNYSNTHHIDGTPLVDSALVTLTVSD